MSLSIPIDGKLNYELYIKEQSHMTNHLVI